MSGLGAPMVPSQQIHALAAYDPLRQRVVIYGAAYQEAHKLHEWNPTNGTWTELETNSGPQQVAGSTFVWDPCRDRGVFFGGEPSSGETSNEVWELDRTTANVWTQRPQAPGASWPSPRSDGALVFDTQVSRPLLFGGFSYRPQRQNFDDLWQWDGQSGTWTSLGSAQPRPHARARSGVAFDSARGRVIVFGGAGPDPADPTAPPDLADLWEWERL